MQVQKCKNLREAEMSSEIRESLSQQQQAQHTARAVTFTRYLAAAANIKSEECDVSGPRATAK